MECTLYGISSTSSLSFLNLLQQFSELRDAMMMMKRGDNYVKPAVAAPLASPALVVASRKPSGGGASAASSSTSPSPRSPSSCGAGSASKKPSPGRTKVLKFSEDEISVATDDHDEEEADARSSATPKSKRESMLARPLPELPLVAE